MTDLVKIYSGNTLGEFFREKVLAAALKHNIQLADITEFYLVNLLLEFGAANKLFTETEEAVEEEPLAMLLARALAGDSATQCRELKTLGDRALYVAGLFPDHIKRGVVGVSYYIDMGSGAYGSLAGIMFHDKTFNSLYGELSEKFSPLVHILTHISEDVS